MKYINNIAIDDCSNIDSFVLSDSNDTYIETDLFYKKLVISKQFYMDNKNLIKEIIINNIKNKKTDVLKLSSEFLDVDIAGFIARNSNITVLYVDGDIKRNVALQLLSSDSLKKVFCSQFDYYFNTLTRPEFVSNSMEVSSDFQACLIKYADNISSMYVSNEVNGIVMKKDKDGNYEIIINRDYYNVNSEHVLYAIKNFLGSISNDKKILLGNSLYRKLNKSECSLNKISLLKRPSSKYECLDKNGEVLTPEQILDFFSGKNRDCIFEVKNPKNLETLSEMRELSDLRIGYENINNIPIDLLENISDKNKFVFYDKTTQNPISISQLINYKHLIEIIVDDIRIKRLSPYETYIYIYLMVTTFKQYNLENDLDSKNVSRLPEHTLFNNYICCEGYTKLIATIIDKLNYRNLKALPYHCEFNGVGHSQLLVGINDPKYDIYGMYISDPTDDSIDYHFNKNGSLDYFLMLKSSKRQFGESKNDITDDLFFNTYTFPVNEINKYKSYFADFSFESTKISINKQKEALSVVQRSNEYFDVSIDSLDKYEKYLVKAILSAMNYEIVSKDRVRIKDNTSIISKHSKVALQQFIKAVIFDRNLLLKILNSNILDENYAGGVLKKVLFDFITENEKIRNLFFRTLELFEPSDVAPYLEEIKAYTQFDSLSL